MKKKDIIIMGIITLVIIVIIGTMLVFKNKDEVKNKSPKTELKSSIEEKTIDEVVFKDLKVTPRKEDTLFYVKIINQKVEDKKIDIVEIELYNSKDEMVHRFSISLLTTIAASDTHELEFNIPEVLSSDIVKAEYNLIKVEE